MDIQSMIEIKKINIQDTPQQLQVNAVVNCARPTLMGSDSNVDHAIHQAIDDHNGEVGYFKRKIKKQFKKSLGTKREDVIRCGRGNAVLTKGYGWCEYVIHAVGPESDISANNPNGIYSSSCVEKLVNCYENIMKLVFSHPGIKSIAIPVISSGNYRFDFKYAFTIGLTTVYNALLEKKKELRELFECIELKKIYFVVCDTNDIQYSIACKVMKKYKKTFEKEHRAVSRGAVKSQKEYWKELCLYDQQKGYFAIVAIMRKTLLLLRWILGLWTFAKDAISKVDWVIRRRTVEFTAVTKMIIPIIILNMAVCYKGSENLNIGLLCLITYNLLDTITYLLALMFLADIQRPSANVSRSLILLVVNYIEVELDMACVFMLIRNLQKDYKPIKTAVDFIIGSEGAQLSQMLNWVNGGIQFFFLTIVLSYFSSHMRQRKFRTN